MRQSIFIRWIIGCLIFLSILFSVRGKESQAAELRLPDRSMTGIESSMPTKGTAHVLVLAVEFPDQKYGVDIKTTLEQNMFGEEDKSNKFYPYESVRAYYERSSYGKFSLSGDIYTFTASKVGKYYENNQDELISEIFDSYKSKILENCPETKNKDQYLNEELAKYDYNGDRIIDGIYFYKAGGASVDGLIIKHCSGDVSFRDELSIGNYTVGSFCSFFVTDVNEICHETGHMLGLDDYYSSFAWAYAGIAGNDMMNNAQGDHASFSKILLGWIDREQIQLITTYSRKVQLTDISKEGQCAVIVPGYSENTGLMTKFLMLDYLNNTGNNDNSTYNSEEYLNHNGGVRIYRVDATLDSSGKFLRDVKSYYREGKAPLIRQLHADEELEHIISSTNWAGGIDAGEYADFVVPDNYLKAQGLDGCLFREGDELTPQSVPSSSFYGDSLNLVYSGVYVKDIRQNGSKISFMAGQENTISYSVISTTENKYSSIDDPRMELQLSCDIVPVDTNNEFKLSGGVYYSFYGAAYIQDKKGNKVKDMYIKIPVSKSGQLTIYRFSLDYTRLEKDRIYEIVIPKGTLMDPSGNILEELKIDFSTKTKYKMYDGFYMAESFSNAVRCIDEDGHGVLLAKKESDDHSQIMGTIYEIEDYKITGEVSCSEEFKQKVMVETGMLDMWYNEDGTWTVMVLIDDYELRCVTFDETGKVYNSYELKVSEREYDPYGVVKNMGYAVSDDQCVYRLERDRCEKLISSTEGVRQLRMAEDGAFVFENYADGCYEFYDADARFMNSIDLANITPGDFDMIDIFFVKCGTGYLMLAGSIVWQFDQYFRLVKSYAVPGSFTRLVEWENGYIARWGSSVYLMDFDFHVVDVLDEITDDQFYGGKIQMKKDGNLFVGWENGWKEYGYTVDLSSYDDSAVEHLHFLDDHEKPCEAGGKVEIFSGVTFSEYEEESGYKNVKWYYLDGNCITDETYMIISTEDNSYSEYFYFDVKDPIQTPDPTSTPIPDVTPTPDPTPDSDPTQAPTSNPTSTPIPDVTPTPDPTLDLDPTQAPTSDPAPTSTVEATTSPTPSMEPTKTPDVFLSQVSTVPPRLSLTVSSSVSTAASKKMRLIKPQIKVTTHKYRKNMRIVRIRLKKYQGAHIEIYYQRGKGKFKKIKLKQTNIKKKKIFRVGYKKGRKIIYIRVRTYQKKGGKKIYSPYSKSWRVR